MPLVIDKKTGQPVYVNAAALQNPDAAKVYGPIDKAKFDMVDKEGKRFIVPGVSVDKALAEGWKFESNASAEHGDKVQKYLKQMDSPAMVGLENVMRGASFGVYDTIADHQLTPEEKEATQIAYERHPVAHYGGYAAGLIGSTVATAGLGSEVGAAAEAKALSGAAKLGIGAAERGAAELGAGAAARVGADLAVQQATRTLGQKVIAGAANAAAQGVLYSTPQAIAQASYGDPERAAETLLAGAGIGAILGGGTALGSAAISGATKAVGDKVTSFLEKKELGLDPGKISTFKTVLADEGLAGKNVSKLDLENIVNKAQQKLDSTVASSGADVKFSASTVKQQLADQIDSIPSIHPGSKAYGANLAEKITSLGDDISYADSKKLISELVAQKKVGGLTPVEDALHDAAIKLASAEQDRAVSAAFTQAEIKPAVLADFLAQKAKISSVNEVLDRGGLPAMMDVAPEILSSLAGKGAGKAVAGVAAGIGHHVGGPVGAYVGYKAGNAIGHLVENFISNQGTAFAGKTLRSIAGNPETAPFLGSILAKASVDSMTAAIDSIPQRLATPQAAIVSDPIKRFLGSRANGLSKDQQYKKVTDSISNAVADPKTTTEKIGSIAGHFPQTDDQNRAPLAAQITQKSFGALQYLDSKIPKNPNPNQPFQKKEWQPSKQQKQEFISILNTVQNPMSVIDHAAKGTLTKAEVEALKTVYPQIYTNFIEAITKLAYDPKAPNLSYQTKIKLSLITGVPMDRTLTMLPQYQMNYQQQQQQPASKVKLEAPEVETQVQRIANK